MKQIISLFLLFITITVVGQNVTIDYQAWNPSGTTCSLFVTATNVPATGTTSGNIEHQRKLGETVYNGTDKALQMQTTFVTTGSVYKGARYRVAYNFKAGYDYMIYVTAAAVENTQGTAIGPYLRLDVNNTGGGGNSGCNGPETLSSNTGGNPVAIQLESNTFQEFQYVFPTLGNKTSLEVTALPAANGFTKTVLIRKIRIVETAIVPVFTISPPKTINCGSTANETFTVTNVNNSPGTLTYDWNLGTTNNGWIYQGSAAPQTFTTSTNSIQLTPSPTATSLSNVMVTVKINGTNYTTLTCNITLNTTTPPMVLTPVQLACGEAQFNVSGGVGNSFNWSASNGNILFNGSTTTATTSSPTITATGTNGDIMVSSTVCGVTKNAYAFYDPLARGPLNIPNPMLQGDHLSVLANTTPFDTYYRWYVNGVLVKEGADATMYCTCYYEGQDQRQCGNNTVRIEVDNDCGSASVYEEQFEWICSYGRMQSNVELFPNPARDVITLRLKQINAKNGNNGLKGIKEVRILNKLGALQKIMKYSADSKTIQINVGNLPHDVYFVEVTDGINKARLQLNIQK